MRFSLRLPQSGSLKDKRQVVRSVMQRVRNKFGAAIAEVADNDDRQIATIGAAVVSNEGGHAAAMLDEIVSYVEDSRLDAEVFGIERDVIALGS